MSAPFPGIYTRPRRRRGALGWAVAIVGCLLIVAVVVAGLYWYDHRSSTAAPPTSPGRLELQGRVITNAQKVAPGIVRVACVMPTAWTPGDTFKCYAYGSSGRELAQMAGTVLPDSGSEWQINEVWQAT